MKLDRNEEVQCGWCGILNTLGKWNDLTYSRCVNREMKRDFQPLTDSKAFLNNTKSYYECPSCGRWSRGSQLRIPKSTDPKVRKLGRQSTFLGALCGNTKNDNE